MASILGLATALVVVGVLALLRGETTLRRAPAVGAIALVTAGGVVTIRGADLGAFARFLGASSSQQAEPQTKVQTYAHRTLLVWIGYRMWLDHPIVGVGWEGSAEPANFEPYLPAAHRRFPDEAPLAFPAAAPDRHYGVQNSWVQALADLGVVGRSPLGRRLRRGRVAGRARPPLYSRWPWIALLAWLWSAQGFIAGIPLDALTWLAFGLAVTRIEPE